MIEASAIEASAIEASVIEARGLAAFRGERLVFRDISFRLGRGDALVLVGPNGAGKSTLLRLLAGLVRPAAGTLAWNGEDTLTDLARHAGRLAYLGHQDGIKPTLTAAENLAFFGHDPAVGEALDALGLTPLAALPARMLSAGQRRRLALGRLVLSAAPLWLLDEPTLGLDAAAVTRLGGLLAEHRRRGGIVIAATHLPLPLDGAGELRLG